MLVDKIKENVDDPLLRLLTITTSNGYPFKKLQDGIFEISHFCGEHLIDGKYNEYPELTNSPFGVCDNVQQILKEYPELQSSSRQFVVTLRRVRQDQQSESGGWRWHKWGPYIGTFASRCEYLYDEDGIEQVFCYHIYELI